MADTARSASEKVEIFDDEVTLQRKIKKLAAELRYAGTYSIAFTGAGISTEAGIPDFRSGANTVLATGAGKWERQAMEKSGRRASAPSGLKAKGPVKKTTVLKAFPTFTHMALKSMLEEGSRGAKRSKTPLLQHLTSQNTDGLHRRSGVPKGHKNRVKTSRFSELHGCTHLERCQKCGREYLRDFRCRTGEKVVSKKNAMGRVVTTRTKLGVHQHETGRTCEAPGCSGALHDSIINFGENLPAEELATAEENAEKADLCIVLGSSLTVTPAADGPKTVGQNWLRRKRKLAYTNELSGSAMKNEDPAGGLWIVNLQPTPLDEFARERINGKCDDVMRLLCAELGLKVPAWSLQRGAAVEFAPANAKQGRMSAIVTAGGVNPEDGGPYTVWNEVALVEVSGAAKEAPEKAENIEDKTEEDAGNIAKSAPASAFSGAMDALAELTNEYLSLDAADGAASPSTAKAGQTPAGSVKVLAKKTTLDGPFTFNLPAKTKIENLRLRCSSFGHYGEPPLYLPVETAQYRMRLPFNANKTPKHAWEVEKREV